MINLFYLQLGCALFACLIGFVKPAWSIDLTEKWWTEQFRNSDLLNKIIRWKGCMAYSPNSNLWRQMNNTVTITGVGLKIHPDPQGIDWWSGSPAGDGAVRVSLVPYATTSNEGELDLLPEVPKMLERIKSTKNRSDRNCQPTTEGKFECTQKFVSYYLACSSSLKNMAINYPHFYPTARLITSDNTQADKLRQFLKSVLNENQELKFPIDSLPVDDSLKDQRFPKLRDLLKAMPVDQNSFSWEGLPFPIKIELVDELTTTTVQLPEVIVQQAKAENLRAEEFKRYIKADNCNEDDIEIDFNTFTASFKCRGIPVNIQIQGFGNIPAKPAERKDLSFFLPTQLYYWSSGMNKPEQITAKLKLPADMLGQKLCLESSSEPERCIPTPISLKANIFGQQPLKLQINRLGEPCLPEGFDPENPTIQFYYTEGFQINAPDCESVPGVASLKCSLKPLYRLNLSANEISRGRKFILISLSEGLRPWSDTIQKVLYDELVKLRNSRKAIPPFELMTLQPGGELSRSLTFEDLPTMVNDGSAHSIRGWIERNLMFSANLHGLLGLEPLDIEILNRDSKPNQVGSIFYLTDNSGIEGDPRRIPSKQQGIPLAWRQLGIELRVLTSAQNGCRIWQRVGAECQEWHGERPVLEGMLNQFLN